MVETISKLIVNNVSDTGTDLATLLGYLEKIPPKHLDGLSELLVQANSGGVDILSRISGWNGSCLTGLVDDIGNATLFNKFANDPRYIDGWDILFVNPLSRKDPEMLNKLFDILHNSDKPKLLAAGFNKEMLKSLFVRMKNNSELYDIINVEDLIAVIHKAEDFAKEGSSLKLFKNGFESADVRHLRGELFRSKEIHRILDNVYSVEFTISKVSPYNGVRYMDIVTKNGFPKYIETKYYKTLLDETIVKSYAKQIHKDILDIFKNIDGKVDVNDAFRLYMHRFRQSSGITSEAALKAQLKKIFNEAPYKDLMIDDAGMTVGEIKASIAKELKKYNDAGMDTFESIDDIIDISDMFKLVDK